MWPHSLAALLVMGDALSLTLHSRSVSVEGAHALYHLEVGFLACFAAEAALKLLAWGWTTYARDRQVLNEG